LGRRKSAGRTTASSTICRGKNGRGKLADRQFLASGHLEGKGEEVGWNLHPRHASKKKVRPSHVQAFVASGENVSVMKLENSEKELADLNKEQRL